MLKSANLCNIQKSFSTQRVLNQLRTHSVHPVMALTGIAFFAAIERIRGDNWPEPIRKLRCSIG